MTSTFWMMLGCFSRLRARLIIFSSKPLQSRKDQTDVNQVKYFPRRKLIKMQHNESSLHPALRLHFPMAIRTGNLWRANWLCRFFLPVARPCSHPRRSVAALTRALCIQGVINQYRRRRRPPSCGKTDIDSALLPDFHNTPYRLYRKLYNSSKTAFQNNSLGTGKYPTTFLLTLKDS